MEERRAKKHNIDGNGIDRLSTLPDSILLHILSFLPTKTSVITMSLVSRRYRHLWEHLQVFDFYSFHKSASHYEADTFRYFSFFVNSVLLRRRSRDIRKMRLSCGFSQADELSTPSIVTWIRTAFGPHLEELHLALFTKEEFGFNFPLNIFNSCPNLVSLSLCGDIILIDYPGVGLPLLKKLIIDLDYVGVPFLDNLLSGCPVLEILEVSIFSTCLTILRVPHSLKRLKFTNENDFGTCLDIDAPNLKYLSLTKIPIEGSTIVNLHKVDEAYLDVFSPLDESVSVDPLCNLLRALSGIKHLVLGCFTMKWLFDAEFPEFQHIIHLELFLPCFSTSFMYQVLQRCPMLQALIIQKHKDPLSQPYGWVQKPISVPNCLISHLTFIHFKGFQGSMGEMKFVGYVLQKGLVLETMRISGLSLDQRKKWERHHILKKFSDTARGSSICQLKFD